MVSCSPFSYSMIEKRLFLFIFNNFEDEHKKSQLFWSFSSFAFHVHVSSSYSRIEQRYRVKVQRTRKLIAFLRSSSQLVTPRAYKSQTTKHTRMHTHTNGAAVFLFFLSFSIDVDNIVVFVVVAVGISLRRSLMMFNNDTKWQGNNYNAF